MTTLPPILQGFNVFEIMDLRSFKIGGSVVQEDMAFIRE